MIFRFSDTYRSLAKEFLAGFDSAFLKKDKLNHVWEIILKSSDGHYFLLKNNMIDLEERKEEGQVIISRLASVDTAGYTEVCFPRVLGVDSRLYVLLSQDDRNPLPSGIRVIEKNGVKHDIVAGAAPESLVFLSPFYDEQKLPEYPIDDYLAVDDAGHPH